MTTTQYFNGRMTVEEMRTIRNKLALEWHPDFKNHPYDLALETMKRINAEYAYWHTRAATESVKADKEATNPGKDYSKYTSAKFVEELEAMIRAIYDHNIDMIPGVTVEIIGVFIWVGGVSAEMTETHKILRSLGYNGSWKVREDGSRAFMWKITPDLRMFGSNGNIDDIRKKYGSTDRRRSANVTRRLSA